MKSKNELSNYGDNNKIFNGNDVVYNDFSKTNENNYTNNVIFKSESLKKVTVDEHNAKIERISFITALIGLISILGDFALTFITQNGKILDFSLGELIGFLLFIVSIFILFKYIVILKIKSKADIEFGTSFQRDGKFITTSRLESKCSKCGGRVFLKKAKLETTNDGTSYTVPKIIGVCEKSNKITKHYYRYDDITKTGTPIDDVDTYKYILKK